MAGLNVLSKTVKRRDIPGFPGYAVDSDGSVWSRKNARWGLRDEWLALRPYAHPVSGHMSVVLMKNGKRHTVRVHTAVMLAFVGPCPDGMECCHNNGNPSDNRPSNLRWDTRKSNVSDALKHGAMPQGEQAPLAKLNASDVLAIREAHAAGIAGYKRLSRRFGVSMSAIVAIVKRRNWKGI